MSSFLQKLKKQNIAPSAEEVMVSQASAPSASAADNAEAAGTDQLKVDVYQTDSAVIIYAKIGGAGAHDFSVAIGGDGDIVTIKGQCVRPDGELFGDREAGEKAKELVKECSWGKFYRQIILPDEVEASKAEAKMKEGVLVLWLPLKKSSGEGFRVNVVEV